MRKRMWLAEVKAWQLLDKVIQDGHRISDRSAFLKRWTGFYYDLFEGGAK